MNLAFDLRHLAQAQKRFFRDRLFFENFSGTLELFAHAYFEKVGLYLFFEKAGVSYFGISLLGSLDLEIFRSLEKFPVQFALSQDDGLVIFSSC